MTWKLSEPSLYCRLSRQSRRFGNLAAVGTRAVGTGRPARRVNASNNVAGRRYDVRIPEVIEPEIETVGTRRGVEGQLIDHAEAREIDKRRTAAGARMDQLREAANLNTIEEGGDGDRQRFGRV